MSGLLVLFIIPRLGDRNSKGQGRRVAQVRAEADTSTDLVLWLKRQLVV